MTDADELVRLVTTGAITALVVLVPFWLISFALYVVAWRRGWSPMRSRWLAPAAWLLPAAAWLLGVDLVAVWVQTWHLVATGMFAAAWLPPLPWVLPAGITAGAVLWASRWRAAQRGLHQNPEGVLKWFDRQHQYSMKRARSEAARSGLVPLTTGKGDPVLGRAAQELHTGAGPLVPEDPRWFSVPLDALGRHLAVIGETGAGKTVALMRLMRGWLEGAWMRHTLGQLARPLLVFVDCKGGTDGPPTADRFAGIARSLGLAEGRIGRWPEIRLDLWSLRPDRLVEVLVNMVRTDHVYYQDIQDELVALAVLAPCGPPTSSVDLVQRMNSDWLLDQYGPDRPSERESIQQNKQAFAGIAARYRGLFRRLGRSLDSGRHLDDFDAVVCTIEGTENQRTASAQGQALIELITELAANGGPSGVPRQVMLVIDEFSAISDRVVVSALMQRGRSLGLGITVAAQGWVDLGPTEDERMRVITSAAGGLLALGTSNPEPIARWAGTAITVDVGRRIEQDTTTDEGTARGVEKYLVNPNWIRRLGKSAGQAVYIEHGRALWGAITPAPVVPADDESAGRSGLAALLPPAVRRMLPAGGVRRHVEAARTTVPTLGNRIAVPELEAGLSGPGDPDVGDPLGDAPLGPGPTGGDPLAAAPAERPWWQQNSGSPRVGGVGR